MKTLFSLSRRPFYCEEEEDGLFPSISILIWKQICFCFSFVVLIVFHVSISMQLFAFSVALIVGDPMATPVFRVEEFHVEVKPLELQVIRHAEARTFCV